MSDERIPTFKEHPLTFGRAHYSWKIVADLYRRGLDAAGHGVLELQAPDAFQTKLSKQLVGIQPDDISLVIKPIEFIRPCFDQRNIAICGWEFPEFVSEDHGGDPRTNHIGMLKTVDDVWCWSRFTTDNLQRLGVNARCLPPPAMLPSEQRREDLSHVPCATLDSIERVKTTEPFGEVYKRYSGRKYLTVLNPFDKRKGITTEIQAAVAELEQNELLIIKLIIDNHGTTVENINAILNIHYNLLIDSPNVVFIGEYLTAGQLNELYAICDNYLCCSSAEGLNLPLIEAMNKKLLAISTDETAMRDYISSATAVIVESEPAQAGDGFHAASAYLATTHFPTNVDAVRSAIRQAKALSPAKRRKLINSGCKRVSELYGIERFKKDVSGAIKGY